MTRRDDDELEIRRRLDICFNQPVDRDCENCLAHGDYDGPCCFGKHFEPDDDEDCLKCRHFYECGEESGFDFDEEREETVRIGPNGDRVPPLGPPIRQSIWDRLHEGTTSSAARPLSASKFTIQPRTRTGAISPNAPRVRTPSTATVLAPRAAPEKYIHMDDRIPIGDEDPDETAAKRFVKDSVWGGGEGFFRAAYDFFRTHRLR